MKFLRALLEDVIAEGLTGHFEEAMGRVNQILSQPPRGRLTAEKIEHTRRVLAKIANMFHQLYHDGREDDAEELIDQLQTAESRLRAMTECEVVYVGGDGEILTEAAQRAFKREGKKIVRKYRCTTGMKEGKLVADPKTCATRKDPAKVRHGRKVARQKKGVRVRKTKVAKRQSMSKMVTRMNQRLSATKNKR